MFILVFVSMSAYAQSLTVTGKVIDSEGYEVIGGSVTIKGAAGVGTVTDVNGNYSLKVNDASKDVLVFSYVGMTSQEVKVDGRSVICVILEDFYNLLRHRRFGIKAKNEVMIWQPYLFLRFAVSCFHCHSS